MRVNNGLRVHRKKKLKTEQRETLIENYGGNNMRISYNPLWKMLIDKGMNKKDLRAKSGISTASIAKLGKGENITTDVLLRICEALDCNINDIMETLPDEKVERENVKWR